jgi:hypothetical protein
VAPTVSSARAQSRLGLTETIRRTGWATTPRAPRTLGSRQLHRHAHSNRSAGASNEKCRIGGGGGGTLIWPGVGVGKGRRGRSSRSPGGSGSRRRRGGSSAGPPRTPRSAASPALTSPYQLPSPESEPETASGGGLRSD